MSFDFVIGDVVQLKSGSPKMTISKVSAVGLATCSWFNQNGESSSADFACEMLKKPVSVNSAVGSLRPRGRV